MSWKGWTDMNDKTEFCVLCGRRYATHKHHLISGTSGRAFADKFGLTLHICDQCHNGAVLPEDRIHGNPRAEDLSKMLGQALWEKKYYQDLWNQLNKGHDEAHDRFIELNGRSYL